MFRFIDRLRQQPERRRRNVAMSVTLAVALILTLVWASTLPHRLGDTSTATVQNEEDAAIEHTRSAFEDVLIMAERAVAPLRNIGENVSQ